MKVNLYCQLEGLLGSPRKHLWYLYEGISKDMGFILKKKKKRKERTQAEHPAFISLDHRCNRTSFLGLPYSQWTLSPHTTSQNKAFLPSITFVRYCVRTIEKQIVTHTHIAISE